MSHQLHYRRTGRGETLVLVHGYLGGSAQWAHEMSYLSPHFDVIAVDLPGFGDSHALAAPHTIGGFSSIVLDQIDALGVTNFRLLGHSMGGMIVQEMARTVPQRITQLILYGTGPLGSIPGRFETMTQSRERLHLDGVAATAHRISARWFVNGAMDPAHALCAQLGCQASEEAALAGLNAMQLWDGRAELQGLNLPTQLIWGEHDQSYNFDQIQALWRGIAKCSLAVIPGASHAAHLEKPAIFREIMLSCLNVN
jgi:pimeloyl-ACP methyl ester carboxylesterase